MLHKRSLKEKLLKGGAWALAGKIVTALSGIVISGLLARLLTPEEMGVYFLIFSLVSVAAILAQLGLTQTIVRLVAESIGANQWGRARKSVILALRAVGLSGLVVACLLVFGVGEWISEQLFKSVIMSKIMGFTAVWVVIISFQTLMSEIYRGFHDIRLATVFGGLTTSVLSMGLFLALWLIQGQGDLEKIIILTLGAGLSSVLFSSAILWDKLRKLPFEKSNISLTEMLKISWPLWITNLVLFVLVQIDLWFMGWFRSPEEVAIYGAASRTILLVAMPLLVVNAVVPPLIADMYAKGKIKELERVLRVTATMVGVPSFLLLSIFLFFGDSILELFFGGYYKAGGEILVILSVGQLANVWAGSCGLVLMLTGYQSTMMVITLCCGILTAFFAWLLVSQYGGMGVAVAASSGMVLQNILMLLFAKKNVGIWTHLNPLLIKKVGRL